MLRLSDLLVILGISLPEVAMSFHSNYAVPGAGIFFMSRWRRQKPIRRRDGVPFSQKLADDMSFFLEKNDAQSNLVPDTINHHFQHSSQRLKGQQQHRRSSTNVNWLEQATKMIISSGSGTLTEGRWHQVVSLFNAWAKLAKRLEKAPLQMESLLSLLVEEKKQENSQCVITVDMYNTLLDAWASSALFNVTKPTEVASHRAREILVLLQESYETGDLIMPNSESFGIVFHCVCRIEGAMIARRLLAWMEYLSRSGKNEEAKPTRLHYVMILDCYAKGNTKNAASLTEGFIRHMNSIKLKEQIPRDNHLPNPFLIGLDSLRLPDTYCYNMLLKALNKQVSTTRKGGREAAEQADRVLEEMKEQNVPHCKPDLITYTSVVTAWASSGMKSHAVHRAEALLREIEISPDLEPSTILLNSVMSAWVKSKNPAAVARTEEILKQMEDSDEVRPDLTSYNTHLHALAIHSNRYPDNARKAEMILQTLEDSCDKGVLEFGPNRFTYNLVLEAICKASQQIETTTKASFILRKLIKRQNVNPDTQPDTYSFNQVLNAFSRSTMKGSPRTAANLLLYMNKAHRMGVFPLAQPDSDSYFAVVNSYARSGEPGSAHQAELLLNEMKHQFANGNMSIKPTRACYNAVIDAWARSGERTLGARKAEGLLQEMQQMYDAGDKGMSPTLVTFNSVLNAWARSGTRCCGYKAEQYLEKMWDMYNRGDKRVKPNDFSYNTVINAISKSKNERKAQKALRILRKMDKLYQAGSNEARPNEITYTAVINSCAFPAASDSKTKRKALDTAMFTLKELQSSRYGQPNQVTYGTFIKACQNLLDDDDKLRRILIKKALEECIKDGQVGQMVLNYVPRDLVNELLTGYMTSGPRVSVQDVPPEWTCNATGDTEWNTKSSSLKNKLKKSNKHRKIKSENPKLSGAKQP